MIHADGSGEENPSIGGISNLYEELCRSDREHGDVSVVHEESGWCLSAHRDGRLLLEHLGGEEVPRHMLPVPKDRVLERWKRLAEGDMESIRREPWKSGYVEP